MQNKFLRTSALTLNLGVAIIAIGTTYSGSTSAARLEFNKDAMRLLRAAPGGLRTIGVEAEMFTGEHMETVSIVGSVDVPGDKIMDDQRVDMVSTNDSSDVTWGDFVVSGSVVLRIIPNDKNAIYQRLREYGFWDIRDTPELRTIEKLNALVWRVTCDPDATWNSFWLRCSLKLIHQEKQEGATEGS